MSVLPQEATQGTFVCGPQRVVGGESMRTTAVDAWRDLQGCSVGDAAGTGSVVLQQTLQYLAQERSERPDPRDHN